MLDQFNIFQVGQNQTMKQCDKRIKECKYLKWIDERRVKVRMDRERECEEEGGTRGIYVEEGSENNN